MTKELWLRSCQIPKYLRQTTEFTYDTLSLRMRELSFLNKGIEMSITDKRQKDDKENSVREILKVPKD